MRKAAHRGSRFLVMLAAVALLAVACTPNTDGAVPESAGGEDQASEGGDGGALRFVWFTDGPDLEVIEAIVADFEEAEGVTVDFLVLPFEDLTQQLQAQIQGGDPPDVVRLADTAEFRQGLLDISQYLEDPEGFAGEFLEPALAPVTGPEGELYGIPHDFTMNGPIVNLDMFAAAGIEVPGADDEPWTWQELVDNAQAAQEAAGTPYAIAYDRSGHRFGGMLSQFGGTYFEDSEDEIPSVAFEGDATQQAIERFVGLHDDGLAPLDVWLGSGSSYAAAADFFVSQQAPVYFAGNWMVAQFEESITDFEWAAMPNPCEANCGGYPGGKFVVGS